MDIAELMFSVGGKDGFTGVLIAWIPFCGFGIPGCVINIRQ